MSQRANRNDADALWSYLAESGPQVAAKSAGSPLFVTSWACAWRRFNPRHAGPDHRLLDRLRQWV